MHILITGSKGLIGAALKNALQALHAHISGIDIKFFTNHPEYGDILNTRTLFPLIEQVDGIIHLAAISRVIEGEKNPHLCWRTNVKGTQNVLELALASRKKPWVIYASSREVYGMQTDFPVKETAPLNPINIYGESKREAERIVQEAHRKGLQTAILRFSNVYGSIYDYHDRVVPAFCRAAALGDEIRIVGKDHLLDFVHLEDVIHGILSLINLLEKKKVSFSPIHLARGVGVSLLELADVARKASSYPLKIVVEEVSHHFRVSKFWGDPFRAREILNWRAGVSIEDGMHRLISEYQIFLGTQKSCGSSLSMLAPH